MSHHDTPNPHLFMKKNDNNQKFENVFLQVSCLVYGEENVTDINHRLLRMALERDDVKTFDEIVQEVARLIFGEANMTELNVRLVRMALERNNTDESSKDSTDD